MAPPDLTGTMTRLQRVIYETDLLGLNLRESMRIATQRVGFFVGQQRYLRERERVADVVAEFGPPTMDALGEPSEATHPIGSP